MVNGPPTPPPSNQAELQDAARGNASNVAGSSNMSSQAPTSARSSHNDIYQMAFANIANLVFQEKYQEITEYCEQIDLNGDGERHQSRLLVVAPLSLAYLILDELPAVRLVLLRLPDNLASVPLILALVGLLAATWERKHASVYLRVEQISRLVGSSDFPNAKLASLLNTLLSKFTDSFRQRTFALLTKAYVSLPLDLAKKYLGLPTEQVLKVTEESGWSYDPLAKILSPRETGKVARDSLTSDPSSLKTFKIVVDSVDQLEL